MAMGFITNIIQASGENYDVSHKSKLRAVGCYLLTDGFYNSNRLIRGRFAI